MAVPPSPTPVGNISSDEWWSINGVSLHQYGWSITTKGGSRYDTPQPRGGNIKIPFRHGSRHRDKFWDEKTVVLQMWLTASDPGTGERSTDVKLQWNDSWDFIRRTIWQFDGSQVILTRRWWLTDRRTGIASLVEADALVEVTEPMQPSMTGIGRADFQVTLQMASPFYYGPWQSITIPLDTDVSVYNPGHGRVMDENLFVEFHGYLKKPTLMNQTPNPQIKMKQNGTILSYPVIFDIPNWLATVDVTGQNVIKYTLSSGSKHWFGLVPGSNLIRLTQDPWTSITDSSPKETGTVISLASDPVAGAPERRSIGPDSPGYAVIKFRPPYI